MRAQLQKISSDFGAYSDHEYLTDDELEFLDKSVIINTGRRTRGKKIDYTQFGADEDEDEE